MGRRCSLAPHENCRGSTLGHEIGVSSKSTMKMPLEEESVLVIYKVQRGPKVESMSGSFLSSSALLALMLEEPNGSIMSEK